MPCTLVLENVKRVLKQNQATAVARGEPGRACDESEGKSKISGVTTRWPRQIHLKLRRITKFKTSHQRGDGSGLDLNDDVTEKKRRLRVCNWGFEAEIGRIKGNF